MHKRVDTPIIRDKHSKKRLAAYQLHIETARLSPRQKAELRIQTRQLVNPQNSQSQPATQRELDEVLRLRKFVLEGLEVYIPDTPSLYDRSPSPEPSSGLKSEAQTPSSTTTQAGTPGNPLARLRTLELSNPFSPLSGISEEPPSLARAKPKTP